MKTIVYSKVSAQQSQQQGLALFTIMIFLLILTVIGISSMQTSSLQQMMAGNMQWNNIAFQAAETGLNTTVENNNWGGLAESGNVSNTDYDGDSQNIDYASQSYYVNKTDIGRVWGGRAWSVRKMSRANFVIRSEGYAKVETDDNSGDLLAQITLEETDYIVAPK